ncbi:unnamed protein product [Blepharisma stoltei]|uniref:E3 ubiquitin-protein ligase n=1 Tax=Blepharisma stoltei TaxID=1481888 RepID=A0AAU9JSW6_9CILI|nr:unnamed protein product [Blepharisma stoltei]
MAHYKGVRGNAKLKMINPLSQLERSDLFIVFTSFTNPSNLAMQLSHKQNFWMKRSSADYSIFKDRFYLINLDNLSLAEDNKKSQVVCEALNVPENIKNITLTFPRIENSETWIPAIKEGIEQVLRGPRHKISLTVCLQSKELEILKYQFRDSSFYPEINVNELKRLKSHIFTKFLCNNCQEFAYKPYVTKCCYSIYCNVCAQNFWCRDCSNRCDFESNPAIKKLIEDSPYSCNCGIEVKIKEMDQHMLGCVSSLYRCKFEGCGFEGTQLDIMNHVFQSHSEVIIERMNEIKAIDMSKKSNYIQCRLCGEFSEDRCENCQKYLPISRSLQ